jgi:hypothetical protein
MDFMAMQDAVLERFDQDHRADAKQWINLIGAEVYELERWTFRWGTDDFDVTVGSMDTTGEASDIGEVQAVWNSRGAPLVALPVAGFYMNYKPMSVLGQTGLPEAYTVFNGQIQVGPPSGEAATYSMLHLRRWTPLVNDTDEPALPSSYHWILVAGASAIGQASKNDPTAALNDPVVARGLEGLRAEYLDDIATVEQWGAYA